MLCFPEHSMFKFYKPWSVKNQQLLYFFYISFIQCHETNICLILFEFARYLWCVSPINIFILFDTLKVLDCLPIHHFTAISIMMFIFAQIGWGNRTSVEIEPTTHSAVGRASSELNMPVKLVNFRAMVLDFQHEFRKISN